VTDKIIQTSTEGTFPMESSFGLACNKASLLQQTHMERIFLITEWHEEEKHSEERKQSFYCLIYSFFCSLK